MYVFCLVLRFCFAQRICIICQTFARGRVWSCVSQYLGVDVGRSVHFCRISRDSLKRISMCVKKITDRENLVDLPLRRDRRCGWCESYAAAEFYIVAIASKSANYYTLILIYSQDTVNLLLFFLFFFLFFSPRRHAMRYNVCDNTCWRRTKKKKLRKSKRTFLLFSFSFCVPVPTTENTGKILMLCIWWSWGVIKFLFALRLIHIYCKW